jgi:hypothetical protein
MPSVADASYSLVLGKCGRDRQVVEMQHNLASVARRHLSQEVHSGA